MTRPNTQTTGSVDQPAAGSHAHRSGRRLNYDVVSMIGDLSLVLDPICVFGAAGLSALLCTVLLLPIGRAYGLNGDLAQAAFVAAVLSPSILYDKRFGALASRGQARAMERSHGLRFLTLSVVLLAIGGVTRSLADLPLDWLVAWFSTSLLATSLARWLLVQYVRHLQRGGMLAEAVAIVGAGPIADRLLHSLHQTRSDSIELLGIFDDRVGRAELGSITPVGSIEQLIELGKTRKIDWILLTLPPTADDRVASIVRRLKTLSVPIGLCPQRLNPTAPYLSVDYVGDGVPVELLVNRPIGRCDAFVSAMEDYVPRWILNSVLVPAAGIGALTVHVLALARPARRPVPERLTCHFDAYDVDGFGAEAAGFGQDSYGYAVTPNADHLIRLQDDAEFRALYAAANYVLLDSRFVSHLLRLTRGLRLPVCTGSDLTSCLFSDLIIPDDTLVLIGATAEQAGLLARWYGLSRLAHFNPPMGFIHDPEAVETCLRFIETHSPFRFCLLAVGSPQQELLAQMLKTRGVARGLALCVGASVNFLTGGERRAPLWMQRMGAEWLFRLYRSPRRLAKRYLVRGPRVFGVLRRAEIVVRKAVPAPLRLVPKSRYRARLAAEATAEETRGTSLEREA